MTAAPAAPHVRAIDPTRVRRVLVAVAVVVLPWLIAPGRVQPDTKVDLTIAPWTYLSRALSAWNDHAGLGELQNQAYGYLFPFGPVMGIGQSLGLPAWACQRVWWSLLLLVAFLGAERLVRRTGVAGAGPALVAGLAYALSCRVLTVLSEISAEAWPLAVAPWLVLAALPMVGPDATHRTRLHAAAVTGLLTAALGGVNATASAVALLLPLLLIVTASRGGRLRALAWWVPGVALGALWWVLPLLVLGRYAYPFLDFIETSRITTAVTSVPNTLRGASHWVAYILDSESHPVWQAGWVMAQDPLAIVTTSAVAGLGAAGLVLLRRRGGTLTHPARFALAAALLGTVLMAVGHPGTAGSPFATQVQSALDGPLAPLRNVHKADPVLRLPLVLGLAYLLGRLGSWKTTAARVGVLAVVGVLLASMTTLWVGRTADAQGYERVPAEWHRVATTVDRLAQERGGSTLLLPASRNAHYTWGSATDEPLSALAQSPVVVRASAPLGAPASTRLLDTADQLAASGVPQPGLAAGLARMGVDRVVVRHDLAASVDAEPWRLVERTLGASPGFTRLPAVGPSTSIWRVAAPAGGVTAYDARDRVTVRGGPESVFDVTADGLLGRSEWADVDASAAGPGVVTDSLRRRAYNNGRPTADAYGPTLLVSDPAPTRVGARDLPPAGNASYETTRELVGLASLSASSSAADPFTRGYLGPGAGPASAVDGDPATAWVSDQGSSATLALGLDRPRAVGTLRIRLATGPGLTTPGAVDVSVDGARQTVRVRDGVAQLDVRTAARSVTIRLDAGADDRQVGITDVTMSAVPELGTRLRLPGRVDATRDAVLLRRDPRERSAQGRDGEDPAALHRVVDVAAGGVLTPTVSVRPVWGPALDALLDGGTPVRGSSRRDLDPTARPGAALDADPSTRWAPDPGDELPTLTVTLPRDARVEGIRVSGGDPVRAVRVLTGRTVQRLGPDGGAVRVRGDRLTVQLVKGAHRGTWTAPDLVLDGVTVPTSGTVDLPCGSAGTLAVGPRSVPLAARAERSALLTGASVPARPCGAREVTVAAGRVPVDAGPGAGVRTESVLLRPSAATRPAAHTPRRVDEVRQAPGLHSVRVGAGAPAVLALTEGANDGWRATTDDGSVLRPVTVDGWRQGFRLDDPRATGVRIEFAPTSTHRAGLVAGALAVLLLAVVALLTRGRTPRELAQPVGGPRAEASRPGWVGAVAAVLVGGVVAGPAGLLVGVLASVTPRRWVAPAAAAAMALAGVTMATLGVVEQQSVGAVAGQLLGTLTLALLARALGGGAPGAAPAARPAAPTATPPRS
ncbi:alpha-(1-_3)-arabinofuranosyltransferase family protein [Luteipulveratus sp. YIM 133132]|uniref:alpha-(1->3)-arabinofuranosyltransferase domain-containing protein n=1 Tax=Luteipulveratus flavus TaxID=3031728 RepID=UPI0023B0F6B0|nr:alpha-(1->3)-arabinofuranosyltransferase family protein [Luteipulveratus sp. YIM 133132]MDE9365980.1 alpha-(1->3)-arabinofuranosyltransferase family protein [Luteipulveratus sp. YIM 133132]